MRSSKSDLIPIYRANFLKGLEVQLRFLLPLPPLLLGARARVPVCLCVCVCAHARACVLGVCVSH